MSKGKIFIEEEIFTGIFLFKPIRDEYLQIVDLEWESVISLHGDEEVTEYFSGKRLLEEKRGINTRELFRRYVQVYETGKPLDVEFNHDNGYGEKWYHIVAIKKDEGIMVICNDISKIKHKAEKIISEEESYKLLVENSADLIARMDPTGLLLFVSPSSKKIAGYDPEEITGSYFYEFLHPEETESIKSIHISFLKKPETTTTTHRFKTKLKDYVWFETINVPILDKAGNLIETQTSSREIFNGTVREADLDIDEDTYKYIAENAGDMIARSDLHGNFLYVSNASENITGYTPMELLGKNILDFLHPEDIRRVRRLILNIHKKKFPLIVASRFKSKTEFYKLIEVTIMPIKDEEGNIKEFITNTRDITERKKIEEELYALNQKLEQKVSDRTKALKSEHDLLISIVDSIPILITFIGPDLKIKYFNKTHYQWFGQAPEKNIGRSFEEVVAEYGLKDSIEWYHRSLEGYSEFYEHEISPDKEHVRYFKSALIQNKDENGNIIGYLSLSIDITNEKNVQKKAQEAKERLLDVLNNAPIVLWVFNKEGILTMVEGKGMEKLGFKAEDLIGVSVFEIVKDDPEITKLIKTVIKGEARESRLSFLNVHFKSSYSPIKNASGEIVAYAGISTDITEIVEAEKALKASEAKYRSMAEGLPQMVWTSNSEGFCDYFNENWYKYTGFTEEQALRQNWKQLVYLADYSTFHKWDYAIQSQTPLENEIRIRRNDGEYRWHLVRSWPVKNDEGKVMKWVGTCTDIHDTRKYQEELNIKNKELNRINNDLDTFVYTASHDLRAPISNLEGLITAIDADMSIDCEEDIKIMFEMTSESLMRLKRTISELTDISRLQRNSNEDVHLIDIEQEIEEFKKEYQKQIFNSNAEVVYHLEQKIFRFSRRNFRSILYNLLSNAIKFRNPDIPARIEMETKMVNDDCMLLFIKDNGIGFNMSQKDKIFNMFKRLHNHVEGTGIGLYIVKRIIENTGGKVEVESEVGKGTIFRLYLKIQKEGELSGL